ncbi:IclR family transcriptional regulator [Streptomyces sp. NPDC055709]
MATSSAPTSTAPPTLIGSVQRALRLLEAVASHTDGAPAKQLAREAGLPLPTAYHLLRTLVHEGYLRRERGVFVFGEAAVRLAMSKAMQNRRTKIEESLAHWRDAIGVPVYFAVYQEDEIELVAVADTPYAPAVDEWADFRETGHAHALGQCLLGQLDERARKDHLHRHPVERITPHTVRDRGTLLERLGGMSRMQPVIERQEYALGTVCAAIPITVGSTAAAMAISLPLQQEDRLLPAVEQLRSGIGRLLSPFAFSISI